MGHTSFMSDKQPPRSEFFPRASSVASSVVISIVHQVGVSRKHRKVVWLELGTAALDLLEAVSRVSRNAYLEQNKQADIQFNLCLLFKIHTNVICILNKAPFLKTAHVQDRAND